MNEFQIKFALVAGVITIASGAFAWYVRVEQKKLNQKVKDSSDALFI